MERRTFLGAGLAASAMLATTAWANEKPLRVVVPFQAGSATDTAARLVAEQLAKAMKRPVFIENKPGAEGLIAAREVIKSNPSGDVLLFSTNTAITGINTFNEKPFFDPLVDLTPIARLGEFAFLLVSHPSLSFASTQDFVRHAKAHPGALTYASGSSSALMAMVQLSALTGIKLQHVPYNSEPPAVLDLVGGRVDVMFATPTTTMGFIRENKLNALMTASKSRVARLPNVPSMAETGYPPPPLMVWGGFFGPKGMPAPVAEKLAQEVNGVLANPELAKALAEHSIVVSPTSGSDDFTAFVREQLAESLRVVRENNLVRK